MKTSLSTGAHQLLAQAAGQGGQLTPEMLVRMQLLQQLDQNHQAALQQQAQQQQQQAQAQAAAHQQQQQQQQAQYQGAHEATQQHLDGYSNSLSQMLGTGQPQQQQPQMQQQQPQMQ